MRNDKDFKVDRFYGVFKLKLSLFYQFRDVFSPETEKNRKRRGWAGILYPVLPEQGRVGKI